MRFFLETGFKIGSVLSVRLMKAWVACFVILFGLAELVLWSKDFFLPLPIYLLGGAFLAIASNSPKGLGALFSQRSARRGSGGCVEQAQSGHNAIDQPAIGNVAKTADKVKLPLSPAETVKTAQGEATKVT